MSRLRMLVWWVNAFWLEILVQGVIAGILLSACSVACGETYRLEVKYKNGTAGVGSAVCVGKGKGCWVFLTAGHVLDGGRGATVDGKRVANVRFADRLDLASFEVRSGSFESTSIVKDWPDGINAQVCGYGDARQAFCFEGSITRYSNGGRIWAQNQHTVPGDSGGAVMVQTGQRRCLAGIHWGYGCQSNRCDSEFVTSEQVCQHLTRVYGDCPDCSRWPGVLPRNSPPRPPAGRVSSSPQVVVAPCQEDLKKLVAEYMAANPVRNGRDGQDGKDGVSPQVDYQRIVRDVVDAMPDPSDGRPGPQGPVGPRGEPGQSVSVSQVAEYLITNHRAEITGPAGQDGANGLVGVPDERDIRNWLIGAMSDPETRTMLTQLLVELAAEDPRTTELISRLEAIESRKRSQRVLIVDGKGNVLDDETFENGEPIILNVNQLRQTTTQP